MYEAFAASGSEAAVEYLDPSIEWLPPRDAPTAGTYRGIDEAAAQLADWTAQFRDYAWEPQEFLTAPAGRVVVVGHQRGRGVASGVSVESGEAHVWTVRHGKAVRLEMFHTVNDALEAVGLRE